MSGDRDISKARWQVTGSGSGQSIPTTFLVQRAIWKQDAQHESIDAELLELEHITTHGVKFITRITEVTTAGSDITNTSGSCSCGLRLPPPPDGWCPIGRVVAQFDTVGPPSWALKADSMLYTTTSQIICRVITPGRKISLGMSSDTPHGKSGLQCIKHHIHLAC